MFEKITPEIQSFFLAVFIAVLRVIYDKEETKPLRIFLEGVICGLLSLATFHAIIAFNLKPDWAIFAGGMIGFFGTNTVREIAVRAVNKKI